MPLCRRVLGTTICTLGILGNILAVIVLKHRGRDNTWRKFLIILSCFDIVLLFESALGFLLEDSTAPYRSSLLVYLGCNLML